MKKQFIFLAIILALFISCDDMFLNEEFKGGDWFYLENDGAIMPVWVRGNTSSKTFIVFLHGGPGNSGMTYAVSSTHKKLQDDYALVYYDQRGSGMAQGNPKPETFTVDQFVEDLDKIIALISHKYNCRSIFLLGKSWGGCFGTAYLLDSRRQNKIKGWIEEDGAHNFIMGIPLSREWVKGKAQEKINNGSNAGYWQKEINWYNNNPDLFETDNLLRHGKNLNDLNGIYLNPDNDPGNFFSFASPVPVFYQLTTLYISNNNKFNAKNIDYSPEMYKITIPSMILWGRYDGTLPVALAQNAYDSIGTAQADKYIHIFENSGHCPSFEEPELWLNRMREFVEKYK
ncbi:MAG: alpha/beta hydrolase [Treponema sp.]|jgi:pimeloyl-ACP methyl ester carboxylesterase|nr:alpha/beta hydrolase [Treponema sp.]